MNNSDDIQQTIKKLQTWFERIGRCTVAVSGGIDSMLLAYISQQCLGDNALIVHAASPAVPGADGARVRDYAQRYRWNYRQIASGEARDEDYNRNPVNRCYYCKSSLYVNLRGLQHGQVITGTNMDDLGDYRPGLIAAHEQQIQHPYVECHVNKAGIRAIARYFELRDLQDLPASPCLASRVETGIRINPEQLNLIDRVETWVRQQVAADAVRFRIRQSGMVLELDAQVLAALTATQHEMLSEQIVEMAKQSGLRASLELAAYQRGSAFVGVKDTVSYSHA